MPNLYLSPSTQEYNPYYSGGSNEERTMNRLADLMEPYLRASGINYVRNDPNLNAAAAISQSNSGYYDVHLALHSNAAPESLKGKLRGIDVYYCETSSDSLRLAELIAGQLKQIYPLPQKVRPLVSDSLGEVLRTRAPAVLVELGYHDNAQDEAWLLANLPAIAKRIVMALCEYFGIPFIMPSGTRAGWVNTTTGSLNLRGTPSTSGVILARIPDGAEISIYGSTDGWYTAGYNGQTGFVMKEFVVI